MDFWQHLQRLFCSYISTFCASVVWCTNLFLWWDKEKGTRTIVLSRVKRYLSRQEYSLNSGLVLPCKGQGNFYLVWEIQAESCRRKCRTCILGSLGPCRQEFGESAYMEKELLWKKLSWLLWKKNFFCWFIWFINTLVMLQSLFLRVQSWAIFKVKNYSPIFYCLSVY